MPRDYILYNIFYCSLILLIFAEELNAESITQAYPGAFSSDPKIKVTAEKIHGVEGFKIDPFPASEQHRNHYDSRNGGKIKYLVMHYTAEIFTETVEIFTNGSTNNPVSSHYVISEKAKNNLTGGQVLQVVPDNLRSWHAGISNWGQDSNLNYISIGIEHVNLGFSGSGGETNRTYYSYDSAQIHNSGIISKSIVKKYGILPQNVLGHEDIAPPRKSDPGPLFPWKKLYHQHGVGAWLDDDEMTKEVITQKYAPSRPFPESPNRETLLEILFSYGYSNEGTTANNNFVILAFKKHFSANQQPHLCDNIIRKEDMFWAWALEAKYISNSACFDLEISCSRNLTECKQSQYKPVMCKYCKKTCGLCSSC
uniref:ShKT domain-containing protein n=1 Tax=Panagrolaimus sp. ES5 TaxID=591445 RepID=A0AC34FM26_9BILA